MLVIRLQRTGRENSPTYRVVLSEKSKHAKKGAQEIMGHYLPAGGKPVFECDKERVAHWVKHGARPSDTVARLLRKAGMSGMDPFVERYAKRKVKMVEGKASASAVDAKALEVLPTEKVPTKEEEGKAV